VRETTDRLGGRARISRAVPDRSFLTMPSHVPEVTESRETSAVRADRSKTTVVIADDHTVVRQGLRLLIDNEAGLQVVAEAGTVPDTERLARAHRPTVLVLDLNMPGGSSLEAIPRLREDAPDTAIVVLTMQDDPAFARKALQAGARGFVLKEAADEELLEAIRLAAVGDTYLNPRLGARMAATPDQPTGPPDDLSERELEVLRLIALGHTNSEIAAQLFLSTRTVETHRAHIQQKIRRTSRAELVRYALDHGLLET
jgi:two-component system response regulator NreC